MSSVIKAVVPSGPWPGFMTAEGGEIKVVMLSRENAGQAVLTCLDRGVNDAWKDLINIILGNNVEDEGLVSDMQEVKLTLPGRNIDSIAAKCITMPKVSSMLGLIEHASLCKECKGYCCTAECGSSWKKFDAVCDLLPWEYGAIAAAHGNDKVGFVRQDSLPSHLRNCVGNMKDGYVPVLKYGADLRGCSFLTGNGCSAGEYKPAACRNFSCTGKHMTNIPAFKDKPDKVAYWDNKWYQARVSGQWNNDPEYTVRDGNEVRGMIEHLNGGDPDEMVKKIAGYGTADGKSGETAEGDRGAQERLCP